MFKKVLSYILLAILTLNIMVYQCVYVYFKANQKYIAQTLCVKRTVKNNTCKGRCQLKKMAVHTEASAQKLFEELKMDAICVAPVVFEINSYGLKVSQTYISYAHISLDEGYRSGIHIPPDLQVIC